MLNAVVVVVVALVPVVSLTTVVWEVCSADVVENESTFVVVCPEVVVETTSLVENSVVKISVLCPDEVVDKTDVVADSLVD